MAVIRARRPLIAEVTATAPHSQLIGLTTTTYSGEVEGSDLELSRNDREAIRSSLRTATPSRCGDLPRRGSGMARLSNSVSSPRGGGAGASTSQAPCHHIQACAYRSRNGVQYHQRIHRGARSSRASIPDGGSSSRLAGRRTERLSLRGMGHEGLPPAGAPVARSQSESATGHRH
jgi:hypothetical protein